MNITICHRCPHAQRPFAGRVPCLADPQRRDIIELATAGTCPKGFFDGQDAETISKEKQQSASRAIALARASVCETCPEKIHFPDAQRVECRAVKNPAKPGCQCIGLATGDCPLKLWPVSVG